MFAAAVIILESVARLLKGDVDCSKVEQDTFVVKRNSLLHGTRTALSCPEFIYILI